MANRTRRKRCRVQKEEKERTKGKESLWLLEAFVRKSRKSSTCTPQRAQVSAGVGTLSMDSECARGCT